MTLGNKIAQLRKMQNITQEALAQRLEVTNQAVSKWESDQCCPDILLLPKLADVFGVTIDALFDRETSARVQTVSGLPWKDDNILRAVVYAGHRLVGQEHMKKGVVICYHADVDGIVSDIAVQCGNVSGSVDAGTSVSCTGDIGGNVDAGTSVTCGNVEGDVDAGTDVTCGNVGGNADAGVNITCGDVGGNVDAGCNVNCGSVSGDVDAGLNVTIQK